MIEHPAPNQWTPERLDRCLTLACEFTESTLVELEALRRFGGRPSALTVLGLRNSLAALQSAQVGFLELLMSHGGEIEEEAA